jgi:hypothetical protein
MSGALLAQLGTLQRPDGSFPARVSARHGCWTDINGFTAATVLRLLRHLPDSPAWSALREPALDWLLACRSAAVPGAFAFWPDALRPGWAARVPADVDDSAMMLSELLRHARLDRAAALRSLCAAILPCRVGSVTPAPLPPWVARGCFFTWIVPAGANVVDCCVNANAAALIAQLGVQHLPGYQAAVQTVRAGLEWAGRDAGRLAGLTPFYPAPRSLAESLEHAVECGAAALREPWLRLASMPATLLDAGDGICRSAYGHTVWRAQAVDLARAIARSPSL